MEKFYEIGERYEQKIRAKIEELKEQGLSEELEYMKKIIGLFLNVYAYETNVVDIQNRIDFQLKLIEKMLVESISPEKRKILLNYRGLITVLDQDLNAFPSTARVRGESMSIQRS